MMLRLIRSSKPCPTRHLRLRRPASWRSPLWVLRSRPWLI